MNLTTPPYTRLEARRSSLPDWLPADLREFYAHYEGVGRAASLDYPVRLCRLAEVVSVSMRDLHLFYEFPLLGNWGQFAGFRIGRGCFGDELIYAEHAPSCPPGSIMAFGVDVGGPGGTGGGDDPHGSLVLASSFGEWIDRLRTDDWDEIGLVPGELRRLAPARASRLKARLVELNPRSEWATA